MWRRYSYSIFLGATHTAPLRRCDYMVLVGSRLIFNIGILKAQGAWPLNNRFIRAGCAEPVWPLLMAANENITWFWRDCPAAVPASAPCPWIGSVRLRQGLSAPFRRMNWPYFNNIKVYQLAPVFQLGWYPLCGIKQGGWYPVFLTR